MSSNKHRGLPLGGNSSLRNEPTGPGSCTSPPSHAALPLVSVGVCIGCVESSRTWRDPSQDFHRHRRSTRGCMFASPLETIYSPIVCASREIRYGSRNGSAEGQGPLSSTCLSAALRRPSKDAGAKSRAHRCRSYRAEPRRRLSAVLRGHAFARSSQETRRTAIVASIRATSSQGHARAAGPCRRVAGDVLGPPLRFSEVDSGFR